MAKFCKECFLKDCNAYERTHIVMSSENERCELCGLVKPCVMKVDASELYPIADGNELLKLYKKGLVYGCENCGRLFTQSDAVSAAKNLECPQCNAPITEIWTIRSVARYRRKLKKRIGEWCQKHSAAAKNRKK